MKKILKWIGVGLGGLLGLLLVVAIGLVIYGQAQFKQTHSDRPLYAITADTSPEGLERGKYLMENAMSCTEACHTAEDGTLSGFIEEINDGPISMVFAVPNLTPDMETGLGGWTDAEIARAIREGVDKDGVELVVMPSYNYTALSDADVAAMIGYLRFLEPVRHEVPPIEGNAFAKVMLAVGAFGPSPVQDPITTARVAPTMGTLDYGRYMLSLGACSDCHQANFAGGQLPFSSPEDAPAANLTPGGELTSWTTEDFVRAVQDGLHPNGKSLDEGMPRYGTSAEDLAAIFDYLKTLPALPTNE